MPVKAASVEKALAGDPDAGIPIREITNLLGTSPEDQKLKAVLEANDLDGDGMVEPFELVSAAQAAMKQNSDLQKEEADNKKLKQMWVFWRSRCSS